MRASGAVQACAPKTKASNDAYQINEATHKRNTTMKKFIIALAAVSALAAGASAAQAKVHFDVNIGLPGIYVNPGYSPVYEPIGYDEPECHYVKVKKVFWKNGYKIVKWKNKLVCDSYAY
jgi:hypothetical protein